MSVQPTTSFVLTQPTNQPPPGSLLLTQQPTALASGPIMLSQPVVSRAPDSFVLAPSGPAPSAIVLSHPAGQPIGSLVHQQLVLPAGTPIAVEQTTATNEPGAVPASLAIEGAPVFSQAGARHDMEPLSKLMLHGLPTSCVGGDVGAPTPVSVVQIASGSQLTMVQPSPSSAQVRFVYRVMVP